MVGTGEVIRGPMSTLYGSDAIGGVINIITKKVTDEWRGNITLSGNAMENRAEADSWKTSFALNGPIVPNKLGMQLRGSYFNRGTSDRVFGTKGNRLTNNRNRQSNNPRKMFNTIMRKILKRI